MAALQRENQFLKSVLREHLPDTGEALLAQAKALPAVPPLAQNRVLLGAMLHFGTSESTSEDVAVAAAVNVESLSQSISKAAWTAFVEHSERTHPPSRRVSFLRLAQLTSRGKVDLAVRCLGRGG